MAGNAVYPLWKQSIITEADANNGLNLTGTSGTWCELVDTGTYTYSAAHQYYNASLTGKVGTGMELTTPVVTSGTFKCDNTTWTAVSGASVEALVLFRKNTGADTTWRLVLYEDTGVTGFPVTPNGGNIIVTWNGTGVFTVSDRNLKENIREIGNLFGKLPIYEFNYNGEERLRVGLIAQEVERIVPAAVIEFSRNRRAVDYARVIEALAA